MNAERRRDRACSVATVLVGGGAAAIIAGAEVLDVPLAGSQQ